MTPTTSNNATAAPGTDGTRSFSNPIADVPMDSMTDRVRGIDFRHLWHTVLEKIWILVLCLLAGLVLALGYLARTPKVYQGHIVLEIDVQEPTVVTAEEAPNRIRSAFLASQDAMRTIEQNLTNRNLLARVIRAEGLAADEGETLVGHRKGSAPKPAPAGKPGAPDSRRDRAFTPIEEGLAGVLSTMVKPAIRRGTRLIDLNVVNPDPALAQRLAEAVGREYIRNSIERRASVTQESLRYLLEEEERLKLNLQKSEAAVTEYKAKTPDALQLGGGAAATGSQAGSGSAGRGGLVEDKLQELSSKLMAAKAERLRLEGELSQIEQANANVDALLSVPSVATAPVVIERRRDIGQLEAIVASLSQRYKDKHPKMMAAKAALVEAKAALSRAVLEQPGVLRNAAEQARAAEKNLEIATHEQEKAALALNKASIGYQELARQAETDRALYETVLRQIKSTDLTKGAKANAVTVVEHSPAPTSPVSPNPKKSIALGLLAGIALGLGIIFGVNALDRSIKTVDQAENSLGLPVLAAVPEIKRISTPSAIQRSENLPSGSASYRLMAEAPEGPVAEAFRNLRAALSLLGPEEERRIFLFTSALPTEGKSFTSANYSLALAQQGHRVLLIDGDLRRPSLHKIFRLDQAEDSNGSSPNDKPGIVDYLVGSSSLRDAVRPASAGKIDLMGGQLSILTSGKRAPNPAELLSGSTFRELVADATQQFDRVVIDSAPVIAVSDTLLMAPHVQSICLVVRASHTARNAVRRAMSLLASTGARPAGIILNRLPRRRGAGYYYYYASHGYGAGEGSYGDAYPATKLEMRK